MSKTAWWTLAILLVLLAPWWLPIAATVVLWGIAIVAVALGAIWVLAVIASL